MTFIIRPIQTTRTGAGSSSRRRRSRSTSSSNNRHNGGTTSSLSLAVVVAVLATIVLGLVDMIHPGGSGGGVIVIPVVVVVEAYVPPEVRSMWKSPDYNMDKAVSLMEEYAEKGSNTIDDPAELWWAFKYVDRNANDFYPTIEDRQSLMERCHGSWELRLAANSDRDEEFYPHPEFRSFAMAFTTIAPEYFGKGIATNDKGFCFVALAGPSTRDIKRRQVYMNYEDYFINGQQVPGWDLSYYLRGWRRGAVKDSFAGTVSEAEKKRPELAFTVVFATDKAMAVRGSKTGGVAIFRKVDEDLSHVAYGS